MYGILDKYIMPFFWRHCGKKHLYVKIEEELQKNPEWPVLTEAPDYEDKLMFAGGKFQSSLFDSIFPIPTYTRPLPLLQPQTVAFSLIQAMETQMYSRFKRKVCILPGSKPVSNYGKTFYTIYFMSELQIALA